MADEVKISNAQDLGDSLSNSISKPMTKGFDSLAKSIQGIAAIQQETFKLIKRQPTIESQEEEEREDDKEHQEILSALEGLKTKNLKDIGDDGGFFAGLTGIASLLGGIALGLSAPGIFRIGQLTKAFENFKVKATKWFPNATESFKLNTSKAFSTLDDWKKSVKAFFTFDMPKLPDIFKMPEGWATKWDTFKTSVKGFFAINMPKLPDFPKIPEGFLPKFDNIKTGFAEFFDIGGKQLDTAKDSIKTAAASIEVFDGPNKIKIAAEGVGENVKFVARNAEGKFVKMSDELKALVKVAEGGEDAGSVAAKARSFMGVELPGFMSTAVTKIDDEAKGVKLAVGAADTAGIGAKFAGVAKMLTVGVAGRALSIAGNPIFDLIATGKDVFDIANAVTDDDVKTAAKKEDIGAVMGSIIGGGIGFVLGGPAGAALGIGLGNMAGEFIGGMLDEPEILGAIENVRKGLTDESTSLQTQIADMQAQLDDPKNKMSDSMRALMQQQVDAATARKKQVDDELTEMNTAIAEDEKKLADIVKESQAIVAQKAKLEAQLEKAEDDGDTARIAFLEQQITITETAFDEAQKKYDDGAEELRKKAQKSTGALSEASTSFFDRVASEGGFFGSIFSAFGGGLEGDAKKTYLDGQIKKIGEKIKAQEALIKGGDDYDWALEPRTAIIAKLKREQSGLESQLQSAASGGVVVTRPTYLPSSGTIVGEHPSWSGRGAFSGGVPIADGPQEAIIPLHEASEFIDPMGRSIAGSVLNQMAVSRIGMQTGGPAGMGSAPVIMDNSTMVQHNNTTTTITNPIGQMLPGESDDFVHKVA